MRYLKDKRTAPPDFFTYTDPDTGWFNEARDYYTWIEKEKEHRRANHLPIPDNLELLMQAQLCKRLPPELCSYDPNDPEWVNTHITWNDIFGVAKIYEAWKQQGKPLVLQAEAERRSGICANCYLNVHVAGCGGLCNEIMRIITSTKERRSTSNDSKLKNCAVCHCVNQVQIWFPLDLLESQDTNSRQAQYAEFCWKKKTSSNYRE